MSAVAMFAASSCNKVEINEPQIETPSVNEAVGSLEFVAYTEAETKTTLNGLATEWEAEDGIDVNGFSYTTYESGAKVIFKLEEGYEGEIPEAPYTAGYPSNLVYDNHSAGTLSFNFSNEHTLTAGEICDDVLAIAYSESDMSLHFKNVVSLIKFRVPEFAEDIKKIRISANEPLAGRIAVNYNDGKPTWAIDDDASFNELVLTPSSGNFVAGEEIYYYAPVLPGQKTNLTFKINDKIVATGISMELKRNVIHYIATLPAAPKWAIAGTFNGWSTTANPMVKEGDYYVARNVTGLHFTAQDGKEESATGFKFVQNGKVWKGSGENGGVMTVGSWSWIWGDNGLNICVDGAVAETAYDIYLDPSQGDNGKFVIVAAGDAMPEDKPAEEPEVVVEFWAVAGSFNGWSNTANVMTLVEDWYVVDDIKMAANDQFKMCADGGWDVCRGAEGSVDGVVIEVGVETNAVAPGKNFAVAEGGFYSLYLNKAANKVKVIKTAELPVESVPDQPSDWALAGTFNSWADAAMVTTTVPDLYVIKNVTLEAYAELKIKKKASGADNGWGTSYGSASVNYLNKNIWISVQSGGSNISVVNAGKYDVYFDLTNKKLYLMTSGVAYDSATEQTSNGAAPVIIDGKVIYLNTNIWGTNANFTAWVWGESDKWVTFEPTNEAGIYSAVVPKGTTHMIFLRKDPKSSLTSWDCWNRTGNEKIGSNNCFKVTAWNGHSDNSSYSKGTWSNKQ